MAVQYSEIQELLRSRADLNARLNLMPYDGTPEIKERGDGKYLYVRKRVAGKQTSTYVGAYTEEPEELYNLLCYPQKNLLWSIHLNGKWRKTLFTVIF